MTAPTRLTKKPITVEALQWDGVDLTSVEAFVGRDLVSVLGDGLYVHAATEGHANRVPVGHWIIKGPAGEFYPCAPDVLEATYDRAEPLGQAGDIGTDWDDQAGPVDAAVVGEPCPASGQALLFGDTHECHDCGAPIEPRRTASGVWVVPDHDVLPGQ